MDAPRQGTHRPNPVRPPSAIPVPPSPSPPPPPRAAAVRDPTAAPPPPPVRPLMLVRPSLGAQEHSAQVSPTRSIPRGLSPSPKAPTPATGTHRLPIWCNFGCEAPHRGRAVPGSAPPLRNGGEGGWSGRTRLRAPARTAGPPVPPPHPLGPTPVCGRANGGGGEGVAIGCSKPPLSRTSTTNGTKHAKTFWRKDQQTHPSLLKMKNFPNVQPEKCGIRGRSSGIRKQASQGLLCMLVRPWGDVS